MDEVTMHLILQKKKNGVTQRVWKLSSKKALHVMGSSKKADVYLPNASQSVLMGFEYRNGQWYVLNLSGEESQNFVEKEIQSPIEWEYPNFSIEVFPVTSDFQITNQNILTTGDHDQSGVLVLYLSHGRVTESKVLTLPEFKKIYPNLDPTSFWKNNQNETHFEELLFYKLTPLHPGLVKELSSEPKEKDPTYRYMHGVTLFTLAAGLCFYLLLPSEKTASEIAVQSVPPKIFTREAKTVSKKHPKPTQSMGALAPSVSASAEKSNAVAGQSAFGSQSRIAQMIAKISNQYAVSKNIAIVKNAKMGDASSIISSASIADQLGGTAKGLGQVGGTTTGISVGTLSNQSGNGAGGTRRLASVANGLTGTGGTAAASALDDEADVEGGLDPELIASFIKSRIGEILYCYERQLSSNPNLYGKVGVRFIIGATGAVDSTRILQSSLQNAAVEGCITQKISKWKFPTPKGGTQVVVTYPFIFKNTN